MNKFFAIWIPFLMVIMIYGFLEIQRDWPVRRWYLVAGWLTAGAIAFGYALWTW